MFLFLLLVIHLCIEGTISQSVIRGVVGQEMTLPCTYSVRDGVTHMCWGRGSCPNSKCSDEILTTDGMRVTSRTSSRYQLRGWITIGDVSLTIVNLKEGDQGMYCCRIEVPGWFNDLKKTLNLQVDRATTTTRRTTTTTTTVRTTTTTTVPITTTSVPLITTVTPPTTVSPLTINPPPLAISNVPPMTTSSMKEGTEFLTSDPPFINIKPSTPSLQTSYGYKYNVLTTESEITTSSAVTTSPPGALLTPKDTENIKNLPTSVSAVALQITNVSSMTPSSTSTAIALLTASPSIVNTKSPSTSPLQECTESGSSLAPEAVASSTGIARVWKLLSHNSLAVSCAVVVLVLLLVLLVLIVKRKQMRLYQLNKTKSVNKVEEPEKMLIGMEEENGIFAL